MCAPLPPRPGMTRNGVEEGRTEEEDKPMGLGSEPPVEMRRALDEVDHIAVYCDAWRSPIVHELLYIWQYESRPTTGGEHGDGGTDDGGPSAEGKGRVEKIRMLKGARLVLADGLGEGVLMYA